MWHTSNSKSNSVCVEIVLNLFNSLFWPHNKEFLKSGSRAHYHTVRMRTIASLASTLYLLLKYSHEYFPCYHMDSYSTLIEFHTYVRILSLIV